MGFKRSVYQNSVTPNHESHMKTPLTCIRLCAFVLLLAPNLAKADGWLLFANNSTTGRVFERDPFTLQLTPVPAYGGKVELLYAPQGTTDFSLFHPVTGESPVSFAPTAGVFAGGTYRMTDIAPGAVISAIVRGWSGDFNSWDEAVNSSAAKLGVSSIFLVDTTDPQGLPIPLPPANIMNSVPGQGFAGLILQVPEPHQHGSRRSRRGLLADLPPPQVI
jgi:hypothetical protein